MGIAQSITSFVTSRFMRQGVVQQGYNRRRLDDMSAALRGWSYACMNRRAETVARTEILLQDRWGNPLGESHWLSWIMQKPNPFMTWFDVAYLAVMWRDLKGNAFIYTPLRKATDGRMVPYQMWVLPANQIQAVTDPSGTNRLGWIWQTETGNIPIAPNEMIHLKMMRPGFGLRENIFFGQSLVDACIDEIQTSYEMKSYLRKYFENDAIPPLVFTTDGKMTDDEWQTFRARWNERMPKHRIAGLLENGTGVQPITRDGLGVVDKKDTAAIGQENIDIICSVFGMNRGLLTGDFAERATAEVQKDLFMSNTIDTILAYVDEVFTAHFRQFDPRVTIKHNRKQFIDPIEERAQEIHDFTLGLVTRNDLRKKRGLDKVDDGDTYYMLGTVLPVEMIGGFMGAEPTAEPEPTPDPAPPTEPAPAPPPENNKKKAYDITEDPEDDGDEPDGETPASFYDPQLTAVWKKIDNAVAPHRAVIERGVRNVFLDMMEDVVSRVDDTKSYVRRALDSDAPVIDIDYWKRKFDTSLRPDASRLVLEFMRRAAEDIGKDWDSIVSEFDIDQRASLNASLDKIKQTVPKVDAELRGLLRANAGKSADELRGLIEKRFKDVYGGSRSAAIARTTATFAAGNAQKKVWHKYKKRRKWISQRDGSVRPAHRVADGQIEDSLGYFTVAGQRTDQPCGSGLTASQAVNCQCYTIPVDVDESGNEKL